ncbi:MULTISPECIES: hypothetical protein [Streptomyces]|uniref:Uncharacterized protein n=1 Tax=Streptomyces ramulosus TaxID=47762 RepID=A0ABW1FD10_9ACTN
MRRPLAVVAGAAAALVLLAAGPAAADDTDNLYDPAACSSTGSSKFKFHIWYNSGQGGAYRNIRYAVYDFNSVPDGVVGVTTPLRYCILGASSPWPGSNQKIKNNAASGENDHYKYMARVYYNSGYKGAQDAMGPYQHIDRFRNVYNENASFRFTS